MQPGESAAGTTETPAWTKREPATFGAADLAACGSGVRLDLGNYRVATGSEFDVLLSLHAPALESATVVLGYDPQALVVVPRSGRPLGSQFRGGIECYADEAAGRLVLIHAGTPGMKNVDAFAQGAAAGWRMRAVRPGQTQLRVLEGSSFVNGRGDEEAAVVDGGVVDVVPSN